MMALGRLCFWVERLVKWRKVEERLGCWVHGSGQHGSRGQEIRAEGLRHIRDGWKIMSQVS